MELDNMMFGNSRGEFQIDRGAGWEEELIRLFECYAPSRDRSWREYGEEFENEVFSVFPYYWGECTCGYEERWGGKETKWWKNNPHADTCYQTELRTRMSEYDKTSGYEEISASAFGEDRSLMGGFDVETTANGPLVSMIGTPRKDEAMQNWRIAHTARGKFEAALYRELCGKYKVSDWGCAVHCTCGRDAEFSDFAATDAHDSKCPIVRDNFLYKLTGFSIQWYKYPLRDAYKNQDLSLDQFREIIDVCIASLAKEKTA